MNNSNLILKIKSGVINITYVFLLLSIVLSVGCGKEPVNKADKDRPESLKLLTWVGYDEAEFIKPLESELGIKLEVKTYVGGDQMYSLFKAAPQGTYDLVIVDAEYGKKMFEENLLQTLEPELWKQDDLFSPFINGEPVKVQDNVFGVVVRWGALGMVYNKKHINFEKAQTYNILWSPEVHGKVGIFDWYLPNMGVFSLNMGYQEPYNIASDELKILEKKLFALRPQVKSIHPNTGDIINDLRSEDVWIVPGIGEWAAAILIEEGKPIDWIIPEEGGVIFVEAFAIPKSSKKKKLARKFLEIVRKPKHLARLSWRKAYHSQIPSRSAYNYLTNEQRNILKANNIDDLQKLINKLKVRQLPGPKTDESSWMKVWMKFKSN